MALSSQAMTAPFLFQRFDKADDASRFGKAAAEMKGQTVGVIQLAVAGKFPAASGSCPFFAGCGQLAGNSLMPEIRMDEDSFQISHRTGGASFHIVLPQLALGKPHRFWRHGQENRCTRLSQQAFQLGFQFCGQVGRPEQCSQSGGCGGICYLGLLDVVHGSSSLS